MDAKAKPRHRFAGPQKVVLQPQRHRRTHVGVVNHLQTRRTMERSASVLWQAAMSAFHFPCVRYENPLGLAKHRSQ